MTRVATGVTGITALSPALSVAARSGEMVFSVFGSCVVAYLADATTGLPAADRVFPIKPYRPRFGLEYIGAPSVGVAFGGYGAGVGRWERAGVLQRHANDRLIGATLFRGGRYSGQPRRRHVPESGESGELAR